MVRPRVVLRPFQAGQALLGRAEQPEGGAYPSGSRAGNLFGDKIIGEIEPAFPQPE